MPDNQINELSLTGTYPHHGAHTIASALEDMKEEAVKYKLQIEERWVYDELQYEGFSGTEVRTKRDYWETFRGRKVPPQVNITQPMTDRITSRMADMLVPTNDRNWKLDVNPETDYQETQDPAAAQKADEESCKRMQDIVDGQLKESRYSDHARSAIADGCRLGCGVLKGPFNTGRSRDVWRKIEDGTFEKKPEQKIAPGIVHVNPWNFFPMRARTIDQSPGVFEQHQFNKIRLREAVLKYGFDPEATARLATKEPNHGTVGRSLRRRSGLLGMIDVDTSGYVVWEFHGVLDGDDLAKVSEHFDLGIDTDDPMESMAVEIWFCQGIVLKVEPAKTEGEWKPPYSVWCLNKIAEDIFGTGAPYAIRDEQRIVSSTWEMAHYDAKLSSGPQILRDPALCEPEDDDTTINGPKMWVKSTDAVVDANAKAFEVFEIKSNLDAILTLHDRARDYAEYVLNLPQISQSLPSGGQQGMQQTASGLAMVMNAAHVVLRILAQHWDDDMTIPRIAGFYDWNMAYHPDEKAKGAFTPVGRGASHLLVKDIQAQHTQAATIISQDPRFAPYVKNENLLRRNFEVLDIPVDDLIKSPEEIEADGQQQDPMEQLEGARIQLEREKFEADREDRQRDDAYQAKERELKHTEFMEELRVRESASIAGVEKEIIRQDTEMYKVAANREISIQQLEIKMGINERNKERDEFIAGLRERARGKEIARKEAELEFKKTTGRQGI